MRVFNVHTLYSLFKKNVNKKPVEILGSMKHLTISTSDYSNFYNSATNLFQTNTFKLPNENQYPQLKQSKTKYFSLKNKLNTFSFEKKTYNTETKTSLLTKRNLKKEFSDNMLARNKERRNIKFFICDNNLGGKYNLFYNHNQNNIFKTNLSRNRRCPLNLKFHLSPLKQMGSLEEIKNPEERKKDFFKFLNSVFTKENYNNLKYEESEIFGHLKENYNYIKDEFNYYLQKEKEIDMNYMLYHKFRTKDYGMVELIFNSARIDIIDNSYKYNNVKQSINIPFCLMSLIFLCKIEQLEQIMYFLLNNVKIEENNKNKMVTDNRLRQLFIQILSLVKYENGEIKFHFAKRQYERYYAQIRFLEKIQSVSETIRYNYLLSDFEKKPGIIKINEINDKMIYNTPNYINQNKINLYNNINSYELLLISSQTNKYKIKFHMPEVSLLYTDYEKQLNHYISNELFIYLYQNNFTDWDFYVLHYLFCKKNFRMFISKVLSLKNNFNEFLTKKIINLVENKIEFNSIVSELKNKNNENICLSTYRGPSSSINNSYKKYNLSNLYSPKISINENDFEFKFAILNKNANDAKGNNISFNNIDICRFKSYALYVFVNNINKPNIYEFNFNFKQMRILYYRSQYENFDLFLKRLICIKDDVINFDYSYFDSFSSIANKEICDYFYKLNESNKEKEEIKEEDNTKINSLILKIREPHIEVLSHDKTDKEKFKSIQYHIELDKNFLELLLNNKITNWMKIIEKSKNLFGNRHYIKYEDSKVKKMKRKSLVKGIKKDFQSAFMQFLKLSSDNVTMPKK